MPTSRRASTPPALDDSDLEALRSRLGAGESPRVVVRAASASVPAGTRGSVVRLGDPGDGEWIVVRLGKDEVPFAPAELGIPGKVAAKPAPARPAAKAAPASAATAAPAAPRAKAAPVRPIKAVRPARKGTPPPLTVTLRFIDGAWTVEAQRGARRLSKASPVRPGAVSAFAALVDDELVREAVTETVESCRAVVADRAAKLRDELKDAEAALKEYEARARR